MKMFENFYVCFCLFPQSIKAGIDYSQAQKPSGNLFGSKEHLMDMASSSILGKQQSLKDIVTGGGKPSISFSEKNPDLTANEASSSDAVSSAAAASTPPNQGGKPSSVSSPHQQPMSA